MNKIETIMSEFFPKVLVFDRFSSVVLFLDLQLQYHADLPNLWLFRLYLISILILNISGFL